MTRLAAVLIATLALASFAHAQDQPASPISDETRAELRRLLAEADTHSEAGRHALAFQGYLALHERMRELGMPRAPVALWNAGRSLAQVPGREREARQTLQRFLDGTTALANEADVAEFRSAAVARIAELDARIAAEPSPSEPLGNPNPSPSEPARETVSPVGPILLGVGAATLIVGAVVGGVTLAQDGTLAAMCSRGSCPPTAEPLAAEVESLGLATDILLISGAAISASGLLLTIFLRDSSVAVVASAACLPGACHFQLRGAF